MAIVLIWEPMLGSIWGANVQLLLFAAFVAAFWRAPAAHDLHPEPRDLERPGAVTPRIGWYAATVASVKATQIHAWLSIASRSLRSALLGVAPWVVVVAVTLPLVGIALWWDWLAQLGSRLGSHLGRDGPVAPPLPSRGRGRAADGRVAPGRAPSARSRDRHLARAC